MAAVFACILAAACGAFASQQTAYADVAATNSDALGDVSVQADAQTAEGEAPIYRMYNKTSGEHFYTGVFKEAMSLVKAGWNYEKVAWYSADKDKEYVLDDGGKVTAEPLHRLYNPYSGDHHYTLSEDEKDELVDKGWKSEGIAFYVFDPKRIAEVNLGTKDGEMAQVLREYNPNAKTGTHNYTMSEDEHAGLVKKGWKDEGTAFVAFNYKEPDSYATLSLELHRMYNPYSGEHFYTADPNEVANLVKAGWDYEGAAWVTLGKDDAGANPVFRVYNPNSGDHHYTLDEDEKDGLVNKGWKDEGIAFYAADKSKDGTEGFQAVYRAYNPNATVGTHHFTVKSDEVKKLVELGWKDEGIAWCGIDLTDSAE